MSIKRIIPVLLLVTLVATSGVVFGAAQAITGLREAPDDKFIVVRNTSGATLGHGEVVIWNTSEGHGIDVTLTNSSGSELIAGFVPDSSSPHARVNLINDDDYFWLQVGGINDDIIEAVGATFVAGQSIGTSSTGACADGDGGGVALESSTDSRATCWINIDN